MLLQARAGTLKGDGLTVGLQQALDDLHLVVDSLDQVEGPLEVALGTFRNRIAPKCEAAGVEVGWNIKDVGGFRGSGPASILQIYRILQEACSNAIRHGKPRHLDFSLRRTEAGEGGIEIIVRDDGSGFEADRVIAGRGLASMRRRAVLIGGDLKIDSDTTGSTVRIFLPA